MLVDAADAELGPHVGEAPLDRLGGDPLGGWGQAVEAGHDLAHRGDLGGLGVA